MRILLRLFGGLFLLFGLVWIVYVMGAVASHTEGYTGLSLLWPALGFHTLSSFAGISLISKSLQPRQPKAGAAQQA